MASRGVNKVIIVGNLGQDPEVRYMPNGGAVANITVATSETWKDKQTGENKENTEWHRVVFFGRLGEIAGEYLRKGSKIYLEGRLQTRKWKDQSGADRYTTEIVGNEMQMLDSRGQGGQGQQQGGFQQPNAAQQSAPQQGYQQQSASQQGGYQQPQTAPAQKPAAPQQQGGFGGQQQQGNFGGQQQGGFQQQSAPQQQPAKAPDLDDGWDDDIPF